MKTKKTVSKSLKVLKNPVIMRSAEKPHSGVLKFRSPDF